MIEVKGEEHTYANMRSSDYDQLQVSATYLLKLCKK